MKLNDWHKNTQLGIWKLSFDPSLDNFQSMCAASNPTAATHKDLIFTQTSQLLWRKPI